jgi:hypothetical protein
MIATASHAPHISRQLAILTARAVEMAERVRNNQIALRDAADVLQDAAEWSGLVDAVGNDVIQGILHGAFANARVSA